MGTQKNHLTETVPLSTQKHMPNIGEKNIPICFKAKQTRNKSKIKVKQSKAGKKQTRVKNYISKSIVMLKRRHHVKLHLSVNRDFGKLILNEKSQ